MPPTRRNALAAIATTSTLVLAGCSNQIPGTENENESEDEPEGNADSSEDGSNEEEQTNELGIRTLRVQAESLDRIEIIGEVTGLGERSSVDCGGQVKPSYADDWMPRERFLFSKGESVTEPGECTAVYDRQVWGGVEYQYRSVADVGSDFIYGEAKTFTLQDLEPPTPEIEFGDASLDTDGVATAVEIPVENVSDTVSGVIRGDAQWFDADETFLGDSYGRLHFLRGGESGVLRVSSYADGIEGNIEDYEYSTRYSPIFQPAEGMEVVSSSMSLETPRRNITGTATNELSDPPSYVDAVARFFDSDGSVIGNINDRQTVREVPEGSNWEFEVRITREHLEAARAADDFEVVLLEG